MRRDDLGDLIAFATIAREKSFTRAAARLGMSQSGLSHLMRELEARIGVRLLARTTRSVSPTAAGDRLLATLEPRLAEIDREIESLRQLRDQPGGLIRLTASDQAAQSALMPKIIPFLDRWPDITIEISIDYGLTDIVAERFDAGIRIGEQIDKDMIAVPIGPDMEMAAVAAPAYLARHGTPASPQDLTAHRCLNLRLQTSGGLYPWEFSRNGRALNVRVSGPLIANRMPQLIEAARAGLGIAFAPLNGVAEDLAAGRLVRLLADWCEPFSGYHLYYPSRKQPSAAFRLLIEALRHVG